MHEASWYFQRKNNLVQCNLCAHNCSIAPGERGRCSVRENRNGTLWSLIYGRPVIMRLDLTENMPLYHVYPGSLSYTYGTAGCNLHCTFCQNTNIVHPDKIYRAMQGKEATPEQIVSEAIQTECSIISAMYTEPTIFMEYALDIAGLGRQSGLTQAIVTNGFITPQVIQSVLPVLEAVNVHLNSFRNDFYVQHCAAGLKPVLQTLQTLKKAGIWLEVSTLIIPELNDEPGELKELAGFIVSLGAETPWHIKSFRTGYHLAKSRKTPIKTLCKARDIGLETGLRYVYLSNTSLAEYRHTYCHQCGSKLIDRSDLVAEPINMSNGACAPCGQPLPGIGLDFRQPRL